MAGLPINAMDLFNLQQLQQLQQQQQQHQIDMQNYAVAMSGLNGSAGILMKDDEDEIAEQEDELEEQQQYTGNYQYIEGSDDQENTMLNEDYNSSNSSSGNFMLSQQQQMFNMLNHKNVTQSNQNNEGQVSFGSRSKESFKKIKPVKRPGLVLKTPIAYQGDIDPAVIPIQRDGMGMFFFWFLKLRKLHLILRHLNSLQKPHSVTNTPHY